MKLSSKTITSIKMFIDLGEHYEEGFISLIDIAKRKDISKKFLEQIVPLYKASGLIIGSRGNQGGYRLALAPKDITLKSIIFISENVFLKEKIDYAPIDNFIDGLDNLIANYFMNISLMNLIDKQKEEYSNSYII